MSEEISRLRSEVEELRAALTTVTEALILVQEFIEVEIGEMSYFRDSGSYGKLAEIFNKIRVPRTLQLASPSMKTPLRWKSQTVLNAEVNKRLKIMQDNLELMQVRDKEQIEIDANLGDGEETSSDEITISKVKRIPRLLASGLSLPSSSYNQRSRTATATATSTSTSTELMEKVMQEQQRHEQYWQSRPKLPEIDLPHISNANFGLTNQRFLNSTQQYEQQQSPMSLVWTAPLPTGIPNSRPTMTSQNKKSGKAKREGQNVKTNVTGPGNVKNVKPSSTKAIKVIDNGNDKSGKSTLKGNSNLTKATTTSSKSVKRLRSGSFKCPVCFKGYSSRGVMCRHKKEAHEVEPQFPCFYCPLKFRTGPLRLSHMHAMHPIEFKSVICPYCNRVSTSATGKRNHMMLCARKHQVGIQQDILPNKTEDSSKASPSSSTSQ